MMSRNQKLILGVALLLVVDLIWVSSSELTKYLYENEHFDKPFFCTYFKTSMFTLYLVIIGLITPWKEACAKNGNYTIMDQTMEDDNYFNNQNALSDSTFVPIRSSDAVSGTESDDSSVRSVRFSKMAEVKEMSAHEATDALISRLSYAASLRLRRQKTHHRTARTALMFCVLWFLANYLFQLSLELTETAMVTLLSSTSSFFTLLLAVIFPSSSGDRLTLAKCLAVAANITGVATITLPEVGTPKFSRGIILALLSAFFYASYLVFVKRKSDVEEKIDIPLFFGFVGLWNLLLLWPVFFILNFMQIEIFELPNQRQFAVLFLNGFIGTVLSEVLWLWGCFLTSSIIGTVAISLQIPLAILIDCLLKGESFSKYFYTGAPLIFLSLIIIAFLNQCDDRDLILQFLKYMYRKVIRCRKSSILRINDEEQQECLIDNHEN